LNIDYQIEKFSVVVVDSDVLVRLRLIKMIHQVYGMTVDRVIQIDSYKKFVRWLEEKEKVTIVIVDAVEMGFTESELFKYFDKTSN